MKKKYLTSAQEAPATRSRRARLGVALVLGLFVAAGQFACVREHRPLAGHGNVQTATVDDMKNQQKNPPASAKAGAILERFVMFVPRVVAGTVGVLVKTGEVLAEEARPEVYYDENGDVVAAKALFIGVSKSKEPAKLPRPSAHIRVDSTRTHGWDDKGGVKIGGKIEVHNREQIGWDDSGPFRQPVFENRTTYYDMAR